jgi:hypothetical protein
LQGKIDRWSQEQDRLHRAKHWLEKYEAAEIRVKKLESPFHQGKRWVSKEAQRDYQDALKERDQAKDRLGEFGVKDRPYFDKQVQVFDTAVKEVPTIQHEMKGMKGGLTLLDEALKAIQRADQQQRYHEQEKERQTRRDQGRGR